tara:strand:+ start:1 stop:1971 length:1971 start_codon:yes stop_codon:yes gene_type:complete
MAVVDKNKLLGKAEKGGDLMVRPTTSLVGSSGGKITETSDEKDVVHTISIKLVKIDKFLKGSLVADKAAQKKEQKQKEDELRAEQEQDKEKPDAGEEDEETPKPLMPKMSFLDKIKDFLGKVIIGWFTFRLLKFLPRVIGIVKVIGKIADFVIWFGGKILDGLITMVHWGYKAFEWTRGVVGNIFGDKGLEVFDGISGVLNSVLNWTITLTMAMIALSGEFGTNLFDLGKNFLRLFKRGFGQRLLNRTLIQVFGKKTAGTILTKLGLKSAVTATTATATTTAATTTAATTTAATTGATTATATTAATTTGTTSAASTAGGIGVGAAAGIVAGAGLLASGLGEGIFQLGKKGYNIEKDWRQKADKKWWTDPRKYWWGISAGILGVLNRGFSLLGGILDIVGAPFRMIIELIRFPFLSKEGKEKQRKNLVKYDTRLREQFRKALNIFDIFGFISDDQGSWGSLYGDVAAKKASKEMGFEKKKIKTKTKTNTKTKTITSSDKIKYVVKGDKVDPASLEKGVPLVKAQQHYLQGQVEKLQFKIRSVKKRHGDDHDTSEMEKKLNQYKFRYNDTLEFGQRYNVKGDVKNIVPLDVNSVKSKTSDVSMQASYEDPEGETVIVKVPDKSSFPFTEKGKESLTPSIVRGGGGSDEVSDLLYKGG